MLGAIKLLAATVAGATPIVAIATVAHLGGFSSSLPNSKYFQGNCHILNNVSEENQKLLTCTDLKSTYYLYTINKDDSPTFTEVKGLKVQDDSNIIVVVEGSKTTELNHALKVSGINLKNFPKHEELINNSDKISCFFASSDSSITNEKTSWTCSTKQPNSPQTLSSLTVLKR